MKAIKRGKVYRVQVSRNGVRKDFTSKDKEHALHMAELWVTGNEEITPNIPLTFGEAMDCYIEERRNVLSPSTIRGYKNIQTMLKRDGTFYNKKIGKIKSEDIQKYLDNSNKSPKTKRNYTGLITAVMNYYGIKLKPVRLPAKVRPNIYIPTDDDIQKVIDASKGTCLEIPILLAAFGPMRRGEICSLRMEDIDGNIIHVCHSVVEGDDKALYVKAPKTYAGDRYIELPQIVIDKINAQGYITHMKPHSLTMLFERFRKKIGLNNIRFHDLRHYSASIQHALNVPDAYIMTRGGWDSDNVLKSVYRHAMDDRTKQMNGIINSHFEKFFTNSSPKGHTGQ